MRLSLWQQFSSNHSSHFDTIGRFESVEKAEEIEKILKELLHSIVEWRKEYEYFEEISNPEREFAAKHHIEWLQALDWVRDWHTSERIDASIHRSGEFVTLGASDQTEMDKKFPMQILTSLGAIDTAGWDVVAGSLEDDSSWIYVMIHCSAPSEELARELFERWQPKLTYQQAVERNEMNLIFKNFSADEPVVNTLLIDLHEAGCVHITCQYEKIDLSTFTES